MKADLVIRNAEIVSPWGRRRAGIAVREGRIVAVANEADLPPAARTLNAEGRPVIPGRIDPHVHMHWPDWKMEEAIRTSTTAALAGGVTTLIHFILDVGSLLDYLRGIRELFDKNALCDGGFHGGIVADHHIEEIPALFAEGITSFKFWMSYRGEEAKPPLMGIDDGTLYRGFRAVARLGPPALAMVHAENIEVFFSLKKELMASGREDVAWTETRPPFCEEEAMRRAILLATATGCPLYIVHITISKGVEIIREARERGLPVIGETCPQYLTLDRNYDRVLGKVNPPLREAADGELLWEGLREGVLSTLGSDHAPTSRRHKQEFWKAIVGMPGIETLLPVVLSEGVNRGRLSLEKVVEVCCYRPARIFSLYPRKGLIEVGADADLVVLDLEREVKVHADRLHQGSDFSPYEGRVIKGWPIFTVLRGQVVMENGEVCGEAGFGKFIPRPVPSLP